MANPLVELKSQRQSVWYDNLNRELIKTGLLQRLVDDDGVSGRTSNPSIFEKAVGASDAYDEHLAEIVRPHVSTDETYDPRPVTDLGPPPAPSPAPPRAAPSRLPRPRPPESDRPTEAPVRLPGSTRA